MAAIDFTPSMHEDTRYLHGDSQDIYGVLKQIANAQMYNKLELSTDWAILSDLEKEIANDYLSARNGKVFATKIYHFKDNTTSAGERMMDSVGLSCTPSTDTVKGTDDFQKASEIFQWSHCNYTRDDDGTARPTALEGRPNYKTTGTVDVGTLAPMFWWKIEEYDTYDIWYMSDSPHAELGLYPYSEGVKADGTVLPFYVISSYSSNSNYYSQPGFAPAYNQSYNNQITNYQKKGKGYWGGRDAVVFHALLMLIIKYATKNSQKIFAGCSTYNAQSKCAAAETGVKRVLLASQGVFYVGGCVSVGVINGTSTDRGNASMNNVVDRAQIKSIETVTVGSTQYVALNLDVDTAFTTTTDDYVSSMPCYTGETDAVIDNDDGSYLSNTDGHHSFRIHGVEYMCGQYFVASDVVLELQDDNWCMYVAPKGVAHVANAHTGYTLVGKIPHNGGTDTWGGDVTADPTTGAFVVSSLGTGDSVGTGDRIWEGGNPSNGTLRELLRFGSLGASSAAGVCYVYCGLVLGHGYWDYGSRD